LNEDNKALQTELKAASGSAAVLRKKFEIATVLVGLALIHDARTRKKAIPNGEANDGKDSEEELRSRVGKLTRALAPVLLPMIDALSDLDPDALEQSDLIGQAL
jgi:hypothetical protein